MKKILIFLLTVLSSFTIYLSIKTPDFVVVEAVAPTSYYNGTEGLSGNDLLNELAEITKNNHSYYTTYGDIRYSAKGNPSSDRDPNNSSNLLDFYSKISVKSAWDGGNTWNREHVWPQSLSGELYGTSGAGADVHHIRPTISSINSSRGNKLFTDFDIISTSGTAKYYDGTLVAYTSNSYWEPLDDVKGDTARIIMYMYMHYSKEVTANKSHDKAGNLKITNVIYAGGGADACWDMLCDWNELDPVDSFEANRNEFCADVTGTRNPFIDNPDFANRIWGDGEGSETPVIYTVSYNVGPDVTFDYKDQTKYNAGSKITKPSIEPKLEGYKFEGWYKDSSYKTKWDFTTDTISSNITLYAKFVKNEEPSNSFNDVFSNLSIKSQLTFDIDTIMYDIEPLPEEKTVTINNITAGEGTLSGDEFDLADYLEFDTNLFDISYKKNAASYAYIKSGSQIRLYPGNGNGCSIEINAKSGVDIIDLEVIIASDSSATPEISIATDGANATIKNTSNATSGNQVRIQGFTITYATAGSPTGGAYYEVIENSVYLNYVLQLSKEDYALYLESSNEIMMYINDEEVHYGVLELEDEYRLIYQVNITDYEEVYTPKFVYSDIEIYLDGYSAKTLAAHYLNSIPDNQLVKDYADCLNEIAA